MAVWHGPLLARFYAGSGVLRKTLPGVLRSAPAGLRFYLGAQRERPANQSRSSACTGLSYQRAGEPLDQKGVRTASTAAFAVLEPHNNLADNGHMFNR